MFNNFKCFKIDQEQRIQYDLEVQCWSQTHYIFSYMVATPSIIIWGLGIPFFAFLQLFKHRKILKTLETREKFGFLYNGFRKEYYYWEIVSMYKKIMLIFISVFIGNFGTVTQALIVLLMLIVFLIANLKKKPYSTVALNDLETLSLSTSMISVYCGIYFISDTPSAKIQEDPELGDSALQLNEESKLFFFSVIVICNILFLLYWIAKMFFEVKQMILNKIPILYLFLFACLNKQKLEKDKVAQSVHIENELLREEYMRVIKHLKDLYSKKKLILNQKVLEKVQTYLRPENVLKAAGIEEELNEEYFKQLLRLQRINKNKEAQSEIKQTDQQKTFEDGESNIFDLSSYRERESRNFLLPIDSEKKLGQNPRRYQNSQIISNDESEGQSIARIKDDEFEKLQMSINKKLRSMNNPFNKMKTSIEKIVPEERINNIIIAQNYRQEPATVCYNSVSRKIESAYISFTDNSHIPKQVVNNWVQEEEENIANQEEEQKQSLQTTVRSNNNLMNSQSVSDNEEDSSQQADINYQEPNPHSIFVSPDASTLQQTFNPYIQSPIKSHPTLWRNIESYYKNTLENQVKESQEIKIQHRKKNAQTLMKLEKKHKKKLKEIKAKQKNEQYMTHQNRPQNRYISSQIKIGEIDVDISERAFETEELVQEELKVQDEIQVTELDAGPTQCINTKQDQGMNQENDEMEQKIHNMFYNYDFS